MNANDPLLLVAERLRCPTCREPLDVNPSGARCPSGHHFDRARQGFLTLFGPRGRSFPGDSVEQVAARERLLASGAFDAVTAAVATQVGETVEPASSRESVLIVDAGAGTGHYLAASLDCLGPRALGIGSELSVSAARRLARAHPRAAAVVADTWAGLPIADGVVDAIQVVFAPRNPADFHRLLRPGGMLVIAVPSEGHLEPLRSELGMLSARDDKAGRLRVDFSTGWTPHRSVRVDRWADLDASTCADIALMGPSGVHLDGAQVRERLGADPRRVRVHVEVHTYRRD